MEEKDNQTLLQIYLEEATALLHIISATLQEWSTDLNNKNFLADLKRDLHTLKGGARMVSQPALSALAHELEVFCECLASGTIAADKEAYDLVAAGQERMSSFIEALHNHIAVPSVEDLLEKLKQKIPAASAISETNSAVENGVAIKLTKPKPKKSKKTRPVVMVVDDSVTIRTVTKNFLERHKFSVITAGDGLEALEKLETEKKPDIILLDLEMPRMNGFQFAEKIRSMRKFSKIPILMITFASGAEQKERAKNLGIEKFLCKPYQEADLLEWIDVLLENHCGPCH